MSFPSAEVKCQLIKGSTDPLGKIKWESKKEGRNIYCLRWENDKCLSRSRSTWNRNKGELGKGEGKISKGYIVCAKRALLLKGLIRSKITCYPSSLYTNGNIQPLQFCREVSMYNYCLQAVIAWESHGGCTAGSSTTGKEMKRGCALCEASSLHGDERRPGVTGCVWAVMPKGISQQPDTSVSD